MPTAKSYQSLKTIGDIYEKNKRKYIKVLTKTGIEKEVRWYSDAEYARMYPETRKIFKSQKEVLGFEKGYITLLRSSDEDWLRFSPARLTRWWGWYIPSNEDLPRDLPKDIITKILTWEDAEKIIKKEGKII